MLEASMRAALRHALETATPLTGGARVEALTPPIARVFLVRSGSAAMLREALTMLRGITPLPHLCVLGREGDRAVVTQAWPGACDVFTVAGDRDYDWNDLRDQADRAAIVEAIRACTHHGFLARGASAAGYENVFGIFTACGARSCFAATVGGGLVTFDLERDDLRRASQALCDAIVAWTHAATRDVTKGTVTPAGAASDGAATGGAPSGAAPSGRAASGRAASGEAAESPASGRAAS